MVGALGYLKQNEKKAIRPYRVSVFLVKYGGRNVVDGTLSMYLYLVDVTHRPEQKYFTSK